MNERHLTDALRASVPPRPDTTGWADNARSRARRRRAGVAAGALAIAAAIATPIALETLSAPPPVVLATPSPESGPVTELVPDICRDPVTGAEPLVDDDLPDGASRVWLCGPADPASELELVGHPDPLVAHAHDAVAAFNALEKDEGVTTCMPNSLAYTVVVEYPDGSHRTLQTAGCGDLRDATSMFDVFRGDGAGYVDQLRELWAEERDGFEFTGTGVCDASYASVLRPLDIGTLTRAITCRADGTPVELDPGLTSDLLAALGSGEELSTAEPTQEYPLPDLVLLTPAGDPISLHREGDATFWWDDGTQRQVWGPIDPGLEARIIELQGAGEGPQPAPTQSLPPLPLERGDTLAPIVCEDLQSGYLMVEPLPATDQLAAGASRVWLCGDSAHGFGVGPAEPLTTDTDRVVDAVHGLPAADAQACTEMGGLTYHLVFDYPDGSRRIVAAETVNCEFVGGPEGRTGGADLLQDLLPLWQAQREANPEPFTDEVDVCDNSAAVAGLNSIMDVDRGSLYRGYVCGLPSDPAQDAWVQRDLPGEFVLAISQAVPTPGDVWPSGGYDALDHPYLVLLNQFGDPVTYPVDEDGGIRLPEGVWTPGADLGTQWEDLLTGLRGGR